MGIILRGLFFLFVIDLILLFWIGMNYGWLYFFALIFLPGFFGGPIVLRQLSRSYRKLMEDVGQGKPPSQSVAEGGALLLAGVMLLIPGPISTACGLALVLPPLRKLAAHIWVRHLSHNLPAPGAQPGGPYGNGNVHVRVVTFGPGGVSSAQGFSPAAGSARPGGIKTVEATDPDTPLQLPNAEPDSSSPPSPPSGP
jgi:UPF0716 protein FxsA